MRFVPEQAEIQVKLDTLIARAPAKAHVFTKGIALNARERRALYQTIGYRSQVGNEFTCTKDDPDLMRVLASQGIKGMRGYYGGFRILAEEEL